MTSLIPDQLLDELSQFITIRTGLFFPPQKWKYLTKSIASAARDAGYEEPLTFAQKILDESSPCELLDSLVGRLTIGETYFLRDKHIFQTLQDHIIRGLLEHPRRPDKTLRFWSAGCATGEEAYSIAILIDRMGARCKNWHIQILGTDVNQRFLNIADQGIYTRWSLRETSEEIIRKYFIARPDNRFELIPRIRRQVQFCRLNFAESEYKKILGYPKPIDVIFCRNVLMYHDARSRQHVINRLIDLLENNGWLITGPAEYGFVESKALTPVRFSNATFYRKGPARKAEKYPLTQGAHLPRQTATNTPLKTTQTLSASGDFNRRITDTKEIKTPLSAQRTYEAAVTDYDRGAYLEASNKLSRILGNGQFRNGSFLMRTASIMLLTRCYANLGELKNAEYWCQAAIESEKLNPELYLLLSSIHQAGNDPEAAIKTLKQALYLDPNFVMAHFQLGLLLRQKGRLEDSRKQFSTAIGLLKATDPEEIMPHSDGMTVGRMLETIQSLIR